VEHHLLEPIAFIRDNLHVAPVPGLPELRIHMAHPGSGLWRLRDRDTDEPPYWAYAWAGGAVLARYILDHPEAVRGKRLLDLGAGSGIVGIAAAKAGADVSAAEIDPFGRAALALNAAENAVAITLISGDLLAGPPAEVDLIAAGDVFYNAQVGGRMTAYLDRCAQAGVTILVGDPGRVSLPMERLDAIADYMVPDFGDPAPKQPSRVFAWKTPTV